MTGKNRFGKFDVNKKEIMDTENVPKTFAIGLWSYCAFMLIISKCHVSQSCRLIIPHRNSIFFFETKKLCHPRASWVPFLNLVFRGQWGSTMILRGGGGSIFLALKVKDDFTKCYDIILIPISDSWASFLSRKMIGCALFFFPSGLLTGSQNTINLILGEF